MEEAGLKDVQSGVCSLDDLAVGCVFRAVNDERLYRKVGDGVFEPVEVLWRDIVSSGSLTYWPFGSRPLRCIPLTEQDLNRIRLGKCLPYCVLCLILGAVVGFWILI